MSIRKKTTVKKKKVTKKKSGAARPSSNKKKEAVKPARSFKLESILVINNAKTLSQELNQFLENSDEINIDASAVEMIDTAILQVLLAIANKARSEKHEIHWISPSDIFLSNISLLGISRQIGIA